MRSRLKKGSNQFLTKPKDNSVYALNFVIFVSALVIAGLFAKTIPSNHKAYASLMPEVKTATPSAQLKEEDKPLTPEQEQDWDAMKRMARKLAPLYEFPEKVIIAQMALESNRGRSHYCVERHNCFGIGAYDSNPDMAFYFENKEQAIIEYMRLIKSNFHEAYAARSNPDQMIELLVQNVRGVQYATDPLYVTKLRNLPEWRAN